MRTARSKADCCLWTKNGMSGSMPKYWLILMIFEQILIKFDQLLIIYVKNHKIHVGNFQGRHFLRKKNPAGMPTHRTGVDNIKNPLKLMKIN